MFGRLQTSCPLAVYNTVSNYNSTARERVFFSHKADILHIIGLSGYSEVQLSPESLWKMMSRDELDAAV